ncbi:exodeoxyribonuclease V subunit alpha [Idiomarina xiamenensis 10-D-4]|uniref:RecBCD enzyme subunit RecD n=2 Tax=Idiomarina xiamenensis TaxID=1207041 RepID=K2K9H7_9GAMM|nr:exodeoxyribonuclease V subunit alpha [Idiomarina xiamenensis 10-D-4]
MALLQRWQQREWLRALDVAFVRSLNGIAPAAPVVQLLAALVSHQYGRGHTCLHLSQLWQDADSLLSLPPENQFAERFSERPNDVMSQYSLAECIEALSQSDWVTTVDSRGHPQLAQAAPLTLVNQRLYLTRLYQAEQQVVTAIRQRLQQPIKLPPAAPQWLAALFGDSDDGQSPDWQRLACALAAQRQFAIITGGPGTGKTTTVVKLLALLQRAASSPLTIKLAAPTGKAAARLSESLSSKVAEVSAMLPQAQPLPEQVTTLHQLLGVQPLRRRFRYHQQRPLPADVVVVDEASMIDLEMMSALLNALPAHCRLILLGDKDQLASVEAGSVLGDLCEGAAAGGYDANTIAQLQPYSAASLTPFAETNTAVGSAAGLPTNQCTVMLRDSYRFSAESGIGQLAQAVNQGATMDALGILKYGTDVSWQQPSLTHVADWAAAAYQTFFEAARSKPDNDETSLERWARGLLQHYTQFQLLAALRRGDWGVEHLNQLIRNSLQRRGLIDGRHQWYHGRPVMMQRNNYQLRLMNGDIGLCLWHPGMAQLRVVFAGADGRLRWLSPSRLSDVETVYAMTVHKSQGSEFNHCALVLPPQSNPVLTRELLYTGITRAKQHFTLLSAKRSIVAQTIEQRTLRSSGLLAALNEAQENF